METLNFKIGEKGGTALIINDAKSSKGILHVQVLLQLTLIFEFVLFGKSKYILA